MAWSVLAVASQPKPTVNVTLPRVVFPVLVRPAPYAVAAAVPVLVYHEMNNGCKPSAPVCKSGDPETVSTTQFTAEMEYLARHGYHSVTMGQYTAWLADGQTLLPARPVLIIADNGIFNFLDGAQDILARDGFTATAALVTGFADAASGDCAPRIGAKAIDVQPGCPGSSRYWDATWAQLRGLDPHVWSFILEAGLSGHYVQDYDSRCQVFDACMGPGETAAQYEARVTAENAGGLSTLERELPGRVDAGAWVVPYSDLGYRRCAQADCTPQPYDGPGNWLAEYAEAHFKSVFVEDAYRNGTGHERFRFDVNGKDTESYFQATLAGFIRAGDFDRTRS
jgi:hypothetical protein